MDINIDINLLLNAVIFSVIGIVLFILVTFVYDKLTPFKIMEEISEKQNVAVAIVVGALMIGISIIIAAAHG